MDDEDFGRNAESNIIEVHEPINRIGSNREPLKFEKDLEMKYSMMEADEPLPQNSGLRSYESIDEELVTDLRNIKS